MNIFTIIFLALMACQPTWLSAHGYFPDNDLHLESPLESVAMKEAEFNELITKAEEAYAPIIENLGYTLKIRGKWRALS